MNKLNTPLSDSINALVSSAESLITVLNTFNARPDNSILQHDYAFNVLLLTTVQETH